MATSSLSVASGTTGASTKPKWTSSIFGTYPTSASSSSSDSLLSSSSSSSLASSTSSSTMSNATSSTSKTPSDYLSSFLSYKLYNGNNNNNHGKNGLDQPAPHQQSNNNNNNNIVQNNHKSHATRSNSTIHNHHHHHHQNIISSSSFNSNRSMKMKPKITEHEFVAHGSAVTCLALGQKSGRVMVTGGDDAKINLWAIGKPNCIMSLNGHRTSIECAKFNQNEDIVGAGSASGAIKLWDLEAAKLLQTLTGHKTNVRCLDFHPYGNFLASGSFDTSIKLWDYRKKSCIITYKIHSKDVHCLKLSPDGRWLASGGNEGSVMLYDIVAGKMLAELKGHSSSVTDVVFHPNEFLLASSSSDGTVKFWDLESFIQVSTTNYQSDIGAIRKIAFHPDGKALISSGKDVMKVYGWEPTHLYDAAQTNWGKLNDMAVLDEQIVAGTFSTTNVSVYMVDLNMIQPFNYNSSKSYICTRDNVLRQSSRRSFNFEQTSKTCKQLESLESNRTDDIDTNGSDGVDSLAEIYNACDYREIFQSRRELTRTPPPTTLDNNNPTNSSDDLANLRILQQQTDNLPINSLSTPSNYSTNKPSSIMATKTNILTRPLNASTPLHSVRQLSESLNNLNLNHRNNNIAPTNNSLSSIVSPNNNTPNSINNEHHLIKDSNLANNNILPHSTSLTGLNQLKTVSDHSHVPTTFPIISNNSMNGSNSKLNTPLSITSPMYANPTYNATSSTLLSPLTATLPQPPPISPAVYGNPQANANNSTTISTLNVADKSNTAGSNFLPTSLTPNKITSVVRPVIYDTNRPSATTYPVVAQQKAISSINTIDQNTKTSSAIVGQVSPSSQTNSSNQHHHHHHHHNQNDTPLIIPEIRDHPADLDFNDFLPKHYGCDHQPFISEIETINSIIKGHKTAKAGLDYRRKQVQIVLAMWATKDSKTALEYAINLDEKSIIIDILNVMIWKPNVWNLDIALILLPCIQELLQSKYESYMSVGCSALSLILKTFSSTIKNNISAPPGIGVDISREERYNKCMRCYNHLLSARAFVLKRQTLQGKIGRSFRELSILMQNLD